MNESIKDSLIIVLVEAFSDVYANNNNLSPEYVETSIKRKLNISNLCHSRVNYLKNELSEFLNKIKKNNSQLVLGDTTNNHLPMNKELIGSGGFSHVFKIYSSLDDCCYAVKQIGIDIKNIGHVKNVVEEVRLMAKLNHTNIVRYYTSWIEKSPFTQLVISEYIDNEGESIEESIEESTGESTGESTEESYTDDEGYDSNNFKQFINIQMELCDSSLKTRLKQRLTFLNKLDICLEIANGIKYLHDEGIIHRDLKLSNILICPGGKIKLCDFGLSIRSNQEISQFVTGTRGYIAPEVHETNTFTTKSDLYSFGVVILELFSNFTTEMEKIKTISSIKMGQSKMGQSKMGNNITDIISNLLQKDAAARYSIDLVIEKLYNLY